MLIGLLATFGTLVGVIGSERVAQYEYSIVDSLAEVNHFFKLFCEIS